MKKLKLMTIGLLSTITLLSSCNVGGEMDNWPYCDLPDAVSDYQTVFVETIVNHFPENGGQTETHRYFGESPEIVLEFYHIIESMHVAPEKAERNFDEYWQKVSINFEKQDLDYKFEYYELSLADGYFVFNKGDIYEFKGDFYSVISNNVKKNLDKLTEL